MSWHFREPTLSEILSDSIVTALMNADGVDPTELETLLRQMAAAGDHAPIVPDSTELAVFSPRRPAGRSGLALSHPAGRRAVPVEIPDD
jgi:hypothetical protein